MSLSDEYCLMAAVRYQLPRHTYGSSLVADAVVARAKELSENLRGVLIRDIQHAYQTGQISPIDLPEWKRVLDALEAEL